jgi:hypothetical protein
MLAIGPMLSSSYTVYDFLGPISVAMPIFLIVSFLIALMTVFPNKGRKYSIFLVLVPFMILLLVKYVIPDMFETSYITNFSDSPGHLVRGLYVAKTGFSNPRVDSYFSMQPGFFWATSVILNVISGVPSSLSSPISLFLTKWFQVVAILTYVPLLYLFYKKLLGTAVLIGSAFVLQFAMDIGHYHYAAQTYGYALFILSMTLLLLPIDRRSKEKTSLLIIFGCCLTFIHQGLTAFLLTLMAACLLSPYVFKVLRRPSTSTEARAKHLWIPFIVVFSVWFVYLEFASGITLTIFVQMFRNTLSTWLTSGATAITQSVTRSFVPWMQLVQLKAAYIVVLITAGLLSSLANAWRSNESVDRTVFTMQLFMAAVVGFLSIPLGGRGYLERIFLISPLIAYSLIKFSSRLKPTASKKVMRAVAAFTLTILIFSGMAFYFSGRNFQSVAYSELDNRIFLVSHNKNIENLYLTTGARAHVRSFSEGVLHGFDSNVVYSIVPHYYIESAYYYVGDPNKVGQIYQGLLKNCSQIYDSGDTELIARFSP